MSAHVLYTTDPLTLFQIAAVLQFMYDSGTLDINPNDVHVDRAAQAVMGSKLLTAAENMQQWVYDEPGEHSILRERIEGMGKVITNSDGSGNHKAYINDLKYSFRPAQTDHLRVAGVPWGVRHNAPEGMSLTIQSCPLQADRSPIVQYSNRPPSHTRRLLDESVCLSRPDLIRTSNPEHVQFFQLVIGPLCRTVHLRKILNVDFLYLFSPHGTPVAVLATGMYLLSQYVPHQLSTVYA